MNDAVPLMLNLGDDIIKEYLQIINHYNKAALISEEIIKDEYLQKIKNLGEITYKLRNISFKKQILQECLYLFNDNIFEKKLDNNPDLIGFENGVYDLRIGMFRNGYPEDCISKSTENDYDEYEFNTQVVDEIFGFLDKVFPMRDLREYILMVLATMLEGRNPHEKFYIWTGVGGNGKSKLLELFELSLGQYAAKVPASLFTKQSGHSSQASPEIARLYGVRAVSSQETEGGDEKFNISVVKNLTGGDKLVVRSLYKDFIEFKPQFKQIFCCNDKPILPPDEPSIWRRIVLIPFMSRFVDNPDPNNPYEFKRDYRLSEKLSEWKEAFMFILLEYYKEYRKNGSVLVEPKCVQEATNEYQIANDIYQEFISDNIIQDENSELKLDETYAVFQEWWRRTMNKKVDSRSTMRSMLEKKFGKYNIRKGWIGYKIISDNDPSHLIQNPILEGIIPS